MPTHVSSYFATRSRTAGAGSEPVPQPNRTWSSDQLVAVANGVSATIQVGPVPIPAWRPTAVPNRSPLVHFFGATSGAFVGAIETAAGMSAWAVNGAWADNVTPTCTVLAGVQFGRQSPPLTLTAAGAALVAMTNVTGPAFFQGIAHFSMPDGADYLSPEQWCDLEDRPPATANDGAVRCFQLARQLEYAGTRFVLGLTSGGVTRGLESCGYAAFTPEGRLWLRPEDIGNQAEQIPASVGANTPGHFRFFPGVFFRRTPYVHGVRRVIPDETSISTMNAGSQPFRLSVVNTAPTASDWLVLIDGTSHLVRLFHPVGSDLRRPDEIWNALWAPSFQTSAGAPQLVSLGSVPPEPSTGFVQVLAKLRYAQYFRCLDIISQSISDTPQDDTGLL